MYYALRPDSLLVWRSEEVRERLSWYYEVMKDRKPAKYLICKRIPVEVNLTEASEEELWEEHKRAAESFRKAFVKIVEGKKLEDLPKPKVSFLDLKIEKGM